MRHIISIIALVVLLAPLGARADTAELDGMLRDHTFTYVDKKTGIEHFIYFGRFGNNYDEYFPCKFVDGIWWITKDGELCLEDRVNKSRRNAETCFKPQIKGQQVSFLNSAGNLAYQAKIVKGNALPLG